MIANTFINKQSLRRWFLQIMLLTITVLPEVAGAQYFKVNPYCDVLAGFRKTGANAGNYEMVVDLGNVTNFLKMPIGTTVTVTNYGASQLSDSFPNGFGNLQWSAFAFNPSKLTAWSTPLGSFPRSTLWYTIPAPDVNTPGLTPKRKTYQSQQSTDAAISGVGNGATYISQYLNTTNSDNNTFLVREPVTYTLDILSTAIGDATDPSIGNFGSGGSPLSQSVESITPANFTTAQRCDFYEVCPINYADPYTGATNSTPYFVGYFILNPSGTMTFTRAAATVVTNSPPPPPANVTIISSAGGGVIGGTNTTFNIQFGTTNGATYSLYFTNANGLTAPVSTWPVWPLTIAGNGGTTNFSLSATNVNLFFRIGAK